MFIKKQTRTPDYLLLIDVLIIICLGLIILFSTSGVISYGKFNNSFYLFFHQLIFGLGLGVILFLICFKIDYHFWQKISLPLFFIGLLLLIGVFLPYIGFEFQGSHRWLKIGNFSFQPAEVCKLIIFIYLSSLLAKESKKTKEFDIFFFASLISLALFSLLIILEPDLGTAMIIILTSFALFFVASVRFSYLFSLGIFLIALVFLLIRIAPYRMNRFLVFLNHQIDPQGIGYHINQALLAIGSGGMLGLGLGHSRQKFNFLPESIGDSIFAIYAEELGFFMSLFLIFLFLIFLWRGFNIAKNSPDNFGKFLSFSICFWIGIQALINLGAILSLIPLTGLPLPFVSYGSTSLATCLAGIGILANISKHKK